MILPSVSVTSDRDLKVRDSNVTSELSTSGASATSIFLDGRIEQSLSYGVYDIK